jgi:F-type H+-transporting ATPase subunit b
VDDVQIDYFTIIAQIINFLVLVFLLRHFLYRPVIKSMDERERQMVSRLKETEQRKKEAEEEAESFRQMKRELSDKRQEMIAKTTEEVRILHSDLTKKARSEVETSIADWYESAERQRESTLADLSLRAGEEIYAIARRALQDLANEELEKQIINTFIQRLHEMGEFQEGKIKEFYKTSGQQITVRSTFEISEEIRQRIRETIQNQTGMDIKIQFKIAPELICGVEMSASDMRIAWSIASYLDTLKADWSEGIEQRATGEEQGEGGKGNGDGRK